MIARWLMLGAALFSFAVSAEDTHYQFGDECELSLNYDVELERNRLQVSDDGETLYRIEGDRLWVRGKEVQLNDEQRAMVQDYFAEMERQLPKVVDLATDALNLAGSALDAVFSELAEFGVSPDQGSEIMTGIQQKVEASMRTENGGYRLGANALDSLGNELDEVMENEIEEVVSKSIGGVLMALGQAMSEGENGDFEQRMEDFGQRMERMGERIEAEMEVQAAALEQQANALCDEWLALDKLEQQLQRHIPEMAEFDLVVQGDPDLAMLR